MVIVIGWYLVGENDHFLFSSSIVIEELSTHDTDGQATCLVLGGSHSLVDILLYWKEPYGWKCPLCDNIWFPHSFYWARIHTLLLMSLQYVLNDCTLRLGGLQEQ